MLVSLRQLMDHAAENGYGHPAFNISNIEQAHAVFKAARKTGSPVIIQFSRSARKYATDNIIAKLIIALEKEYREIPFAVHQDHGNSFATCLTAMQNGFSSVMIDGSLESDGKTVASFEYNAALSKKVVEAAHAMGVSVEGELGVLGSLETGKGDKEDGHGAEGVLSREQLLTDPAQAAEFVKLTGVDSLAVAIGTSHGAYKFSKKPTGDVLAIGRIAEISKATGGTHLVMHGSSSVPQKFQDMINEFGGKIPQTFGVPVEEIQIGIKNGVRKVNIDTDLRMAFTAAIRKEFATNPAEFDPRKYLGEGMKAMQELCEERYEKFFAADKISNFKGKSLAEMQDYYSKK
ncbi:MAG: fructose-bisphosphate aldolase class II [Alphaproteobacteria bacterium]|nr:fructose-bisphosphate aldolase class II [Alphaproteobacteria bacterium]